MRKDRKPTTPWHHECLERRVLMSTANWVGANGGSWNVSSNWSPASVPQSADDVVISQSGTPQINLSGSTSINSLTITNGKLNVSGGTLSVTGATSVASGSTLTLPTGTAGTGVGTNLLDNAGFESPSAGTGTTTPPGTWGQWGSSFVSTTAAHSGSQSLVESGSNSGVYQDISATPGVSYAASVYALTPSSDRITGGQGAYLQLVFTNSSGGTISSPSTWVTLLSSSSPAGVWTNYTASIIAPAAAVTIRMYLQCGDYSVAGTGSAYLDDIQLGPTAISTSSLRSATLLNSGNITIGGADTITTSGAYTQTNSGNLTALLGSPAGGNDYGSLTVGGTAALAGTFTASLINSYTPSISDGFTLINYASETGGFTTVQLPGNSNYQFRSGLNRTYLGISAVPPALTTSVNTSTVVATASNNLVGANLVLWDYKLTTPQTQQMVQAAGLHLFRFPGGSATDGFHFNVATTYGGPAIPQFASFISQAGGTGIATIDYGSGSPQEAEAELAYLEGSTADSATIGTGIEWNTTANSNQGAWQNVNWGTVAYWAGLRATSPLSTDDGLNFLRINQPVPFSNINYWEVGNEEYGASWETDFHGVAGPGGVSTGLAHDPATYAKFTAAFAGFVASDSILPSIQIGIDSGNPTGSGDNNWTKNVVTNLSADGYVPGFISDHSYMYGPGSENDSVLLNGTVSNPTSIDDWSTRYADYEAMLQQAIGSKAGSVKLLATEFNSNYGVEGKQMTSIVNGIFVADSIGSLLNSGYSGGLIWDLRNGWTTTGNNSPTLYGWRQGGDEGILGDSTYTNTPSTGAYVPYPSYFAEQLASKIMQTGGAALSTAGNYNQLTVYTVLEPNGHLDLMVLNKNSDATLTDQFNLTGFTPGTQAQVWQYGEAEDYAQSQSTTGASSLTNSTVTLGVNGNTFSYSFPAYSMTVIDLTRPSLIVTRGTTTLPAGAGSAINAQLFSNVNISSGASLVLASSATHSGRTLLDTQSLTFTGSSSYWGGLLDLNNNDLEVTGGNLADITNQIAQGYNNPTAGIISSAAINNTTHLTTLGVILNSGLFSSGNPFDGTAPTSNAVLIKYTYFGDANLDGKVDGTDYSRIDSGFLAHTTGWINGDFNYDGIVDGSDYTLIDNAFNSQGATLAATAANVVSIPRQRFLAPTLFQTSTPIAFDPPVDLSKQKKDVIDRLGLAG